jgi:hypothetical protein
LGGIELNNPALPAQVQGFRFFGTRVKPFSMAVAAIRASSAVQAVSAREGHRKSVRMRFQFA